MVLFSDPTRTLSMKDFQVFDVLLHPVWIFDIERMRMIYANQSALHDLYDDTPLEDLQAHRFGESLPDSTQAQLREQLKLIVAGETVHRVWTIYPRQHQTATEGSSVPSTRITKTIGVTSSGIRFQDGRILSVSEMQVTPDSMGSSEGTFGDSAVRSIEILRHLPIPVRQYNHQGKLQYQNPASMQLHGVHLGGNTDIDEKESCNYEASAELTNRNQDSKYPEPDAKKQKTERNDFKACFVDESIGMRLFNELLQETKDDGDQSIILQERAQLHTIEGAKWVPITLRSARDAVTAKPIILQTSDAVCSSSPGLVRSIDLSKKQQMKQKEEETSEAK